MCPLTDYVRGHCAVVNPGLDSGFFIAAIIMTVVLLANTLLEYLLRLEQVRRFSSSGTVSWGRYTMLLRVASSWWYILLVDVTMVIGLAWCSGYTVLVVLFVLLSAVMQPAIMAPVLAMLAAACSVGYFVSVQMKGMARKAKASVRDLLSESNKALEDLEAEISADASLLASAQGGENKEDDDEEDMSHAMEELEQHLLVVLGLSRGQLLLLEVEAVLLFLGIASFLLIGVMLFLGADAWIAQLSANGATLVTAITIIQTQAGDVKDEDYQKMQKILQEASNSLKKESKKTA